MNRKI